MITVKIPAAMRSSSPVACGFGDHVNRIGVISDDYKHGDPRAIVAFRPNPDVFESIEFVEVGCLALIISDPTGAAHLAWWLLYSVRWTMTAHVERIEAMGWTLAGYQAAVDCAARGLSADLARLADYAHRVAGVTNG